MSNFQGSCQSLGAVFFIAHIHKYAPHKKTFLPSIYVTLTNPQFFTFHFWGENPSSSLLPRAERVYQVPDLWHSSSPKRITWICESTASTSLGAVFFIAHIHKYAPHKKTFLPSIYGTLTNPQFFTFHFWGHIILIRLIHFYKCTTVQEQTRIENILRGVSNHFRWAINFRVFEQMPLRKQTGAFVS